MAEATVLQVLPALGAGGVERGTVEIAQALQQAGLRALVASAGGPLEHELARCGARHFRLPLASRSPLGIWRNARALAQLIAAERVDIVHARSRAPAWSALFAARRTGRRLVTTWHGTYTENFPGKRRYNRVMASGDRVIAISRFIAGHLAARTPVDPACIRVIPRGIDPRKFDPHSVNGARIEAMTRHLGVPDGAPIVLLPGRITRWKGQAVLVDAIALLSRADVVAVLLGDDQGREGFRAELEARIAGRGLVGRVFFRPHVADMPAALLLASVVVSASTDPEGFGRVVIEGQAMGRPVVATNHGGAAETVLDGATGLLVPPGEPAALAAAIETMLGLDPASAAALGTRAREHVLEQGYTTEAMCAATLAVYRELL
ncbi:MAG: glycosyltransferase family 4 protein [Acetobacteraceae bacterium]|nr:glycosyltransferase family 4 protein [Acetobacteraceae bacterium]